MSRAFPLGGLLRFRKLQEEQAAADLARANADRWRAEARRAVATNELAAHELATNVDVGTWRKSIATRSALRGMVTEAAAATVTAMTDVRRSELAWSDARRRSVPLEKLAEKHVVRESVEDLRQEQIVLDEVATRRSQRGAFRPDDVA